MPHAIPADAAPGLKGEVMLYENVVVFADAGNSANAAKMAYLSAPDVVKIGDCLEVHRAPPRDRPVQAAGRGQPREPADGHLPAAGGTASPAVDPELAAALKELADFDAKGPPRGRQAQGGRVAHRPRRSSSRT